MTALRGLVLYALACAGTGLMVKDDIIPVYNLTFCNAYADSTPLNVYTLRRMARVTEEPLKYKECRLIPMQLVEGELIEFKLGGISVGTFRASGLPRTTASLVLVPYHRTKGSLAAAFASHSFGTQAGQQAQMVVIDAYAGTLNGTMKIETYGEKRRRIMEMKSGSQVRLSSGSYQIDLNDASGKRIQAAALKAAADARYVVLRVGSEADHFTQELVVSSVEGNAGVQSTRRSRGTRASRAPAAALSGPASVPLPPQPRRPLLQRPRHKF
ncbi:unnamed protein product [Prorocentrum cordatum]|uniref:Uncharacterized protein n=1 Tax=Prorocentrum cordatum TaxID=2364126 RepID=A0ABN9TTB9_9DINO|nr:unnamed protein product [Polarella glacialis]